HGALTFGRFLPAVAEQVADQRFVRLEPHATLFLAAHRGIHRTLDLLALAQTAVVRVAAHQHGGHQTIGTVTIHVEDTWRSSKTPERSADAPALIGMEPVLGFEPRTCGLRNRCSATELHRRIVELRGNDS